MGRTRVNNKMANVENSFHSLTEKISKTKLSPETKEIFTLLLTFFNTIQVEKDEKIKKFEEEIANLKKQQNELQKELQDTTNELRTDQNDSIEQNERKDTLIMTGTQMPEFQPGENLKSVTRDLLNESLQLGTNATDFAFAVRLGKKPENGPDRRGIIFKMCRPDMGNNIIKACKQFKPSFYINTSLTPIRSKVFYALRQCKRQYPNKIYKVRNNNGNIEMCVRSNSKFIAVNSRKCLTNILRELNIPLVSLNITL